MNSARRSNSFKAYMADMERVRALGGLHVIGSGTATKPAASITSCAVALPVRATPAPRVSSFRWRTS